MKLHYIIYLLVLSANCFAQNLIIDNNNKLKTKDSVRTDGIYYGSKVENNARQYLRFFKNGLVLSAHINSKASISQIEKWFDLNMSMPCIGHYNNKNNVGKFFIQCMNKSGAYSKFNYSINRNKLEIVGGYFYNNRIIGEEVTTVFKFSKSSYKNFYQEPKSAPILKEWISDWIDSLGIYVNYLDTNFTGTLYSYYKNGKPEYQYQLNNGIFDGRQLVWFENGNINSDFTFRNGIVDSVCSVYFESGKKFEETNWKMGKENGQWTYWYENGNIQAIESYSQGIPFGIWKRWNEKGKLIYSEKITD